MTDKSTTRTEFLPGTERLLPAMLLLFVGSGCAALIYETIWYQMLQLVVGLTTVSLGVLLATFMGGMCLGSYLLPRLVPEKFHPLKVYAILELGIGGIGICMLYVLPALSGFYSDHFGYGFGGMVLRSSIAAICLLPPTLLMGATLPAVARWVKSDSRGVSWLGFFYGGNIAGAVFGCLFAGFYLLRIHDVFFGTYVAVAINVAVFLLAMLLASKAPYRTEINVADEVSIPRGKLLSRVPYFVIALSGLTALGAEVVWTRQLGLILGGTVYTFSIILGVFLAGLGIGSSIGSILARDSKNLKLLLGLCQLLLVAAISWTAYALAVSLPYWPIDPRLAMTPWVMFQSDISRTLWATLPATLLWGASFPLALASAAGPRQDPGRLVGGVYAANTVGAIVGALAFSLFIAPKLGGQGAQRVLIVIAAISAFTVLFSAMIPARASKDKQPDSVWVGMAVALLLLIGVTCFFVISVKPAPWGLIAHGRYFPTQVYNLIPGITDLDDVEYTPPYETTWAIYEGEGVNGNVLVTESAAGMRSFHAAGKTQASNDPLDMKLQRMLGHLSALAIDEPKSVLVVACGAGVTAGTFLLHPTIERIVIVDIEELVPKYVTPYFSRENYQIADGLVHEQDNILEFEIDGRKKTVEYVFDDGRHYIRTTKETFDIISSDPIDPWLKGQAALNTVEYYQMAKDKLNPGGVMSLWIPLYESNLETFKSVVSTFFTVFDEGILWSNDYEGFGYDAVLFGQLGGTHFNIEKLEKRMNDQWRVKKSLAEVELNSAMDLLATFAAYAPQAQEWMKDAPINHDRDLKLQYLAGFNLNTWEEDYLLKNLRSYLRFPDNIITGSEDNIAELRRRLNLD